MYSRSRTWATLGGSFGAILAVGMLLPYVAGDEVGGLDLSATGDQSVLNDAELTPLEQDPATGAPAETSTEESSTVATVAPRPSAGASPDIPSGSAPRAALTATDRGVTAEGVKVGFLMLDVGGLSRVGVDTTGVDPEQQRLLFQAYVDEINGAGGLNGRRIEPVYRSFDPISEDDMRAACLEMTQDHKVFAVVGNSGYQGQSLLCVSEENETPVIVPGQAIPKTWYQRAEGRLVTMVQNGTRQLFNYVHEFHAAGALRDRTIGLLTTDAPAQMASVDTGLHPALQQYGYSLAHISRLADDQATAGSQIPVEIQRMRAAGVDTVLVVAGFLHTTQWVQAAEGQGWRPGYLVSELGGMTSDFETQAMPASYDGAIALTSMRWGEWRVGLPEPAVDRHCRQLYERASGRTLTRNDGDDTNDAYGTLMFACAVTRVFHAAAQAAGPDLTRASFAEAVQRLGPVPVPWYLPGGFGPGKTDLADSVRFLRWHRDCTCYRPLDAPRPVRHTQV